MQVESVRFTVRIKGENKQGEVFYAEIHTHATRSDVVNISERLGRKLGWSTPYTCTEEKAFSIPSDGLAEKLWQESRVRLGEFNLNPQLLVLKNVYR